jgi:hypothetical protein
MAGSCIPAKKHQQTQTANKLHRFMESKKINCSKTLEQVAKHCFSVTCLPPAVFKTLFLEFYGKGLQFYGKGLHSFFTKSYLVFERKFLRSLTAREIKHSQMHTINKKLASTA